MAESGEAGAGRMAEPLEIVAAIEALLDAQPKPLAGRKIIVTSGPTHEPIDPVRYIANRSSGKQGHAIAAALARLGADVRLVSGPVTIPDPAGVKTIHVETRRRNARRCRSSFCPPTPRSSSPPSPTGARKIPPARRSRRSPAKVRRR